MKDLSNYLLTLIIVLVFTGIGIISIKYLGNDNSVEEIAEKVIKAETGADIDLSPETEADIQK